MPKGNQEQLLNFINEYKNETEVVGFIVEYTSKEDFMKLNELPKTSAITLDENYGVVYTPFNNVINILSYIKAFPEFDNPAVYTLSEITPVEASDAPKFNTSPYLSLTGKDVLIGIVDTGIDYLNSEFIKEDGKTRILRIWDQSLDNTKPVIGLKLGVEFNEEDINKALEVRLQGGDPYTVVPTKDEVGHGTMVAGIASARGYVEKVRGVAPQSDIAMVKLQLASKAILKYSGYNDVKVPVYEAIDIAVAIRYLSKVATELRKPMVVIIALGSNLGGHDGTSIVEGTIDAVSTQLGVVCVTGTGNEGDTDTHTEGRFSQTGEIQNIELRVDKNQRNLNFNIYIKKPDVVSLSVISPSGEVVEKIQIKINKAEEYVFIYEGTKMNVRYNIPSLGTGDEVIIIRLSDLKEGIWQFRLYADYIVDGRYSSWLPQKILLEPDTKFLNPSPYQTLTIPGTSRLGITTAYYNQNNNATVGSSGRGYTRDGKISPIVACGGINSPIIKPGGDLGIASGSSVATAILGGVCSLLLQWGIVNGNDTQMFSTSIASYIIRGARMRAGDIYPNREWGYGMISLQKIFDAIRGDVGNVSTRSSEYMVGDLFVRNPN